MKIWSKTRESYFAPLFLRWTILGFWLSQTSLLPLLLLATLYKKCKVHLFFKIMSEITLCWTMYLYSNTLLIEFTTFGTAWHLQHASMWLIQICTSSNDLSKGLLLSLLNLICLTWNYSEIVDRKEIKNTISNLNSLKRPFPSH